MALTKNDPLADLVALEAEEDRRAQEALRCYRPHKQMPFHTATANELILSGGKRSGKTTGAASEFASRVLGVPIHGPHNRKIKPKWPVSIPSDTHLYFVIGWDIDHIGQTIYRKLFEPGLFRIIKDKATGRWRTYNPADEYDAARYKQSRPAQPLIPERLIDTSKAVKGFVWENSGARNFSQVFLKNGAVICAFPSSAKHPKQGDAVSGIWIDEDIQYPGHLKEWQDRLTDKNGWLIWSVWPHAKNYALCELLDRADEVRDDPKPPVQHFQLAMSENPFIPKEHKRLALGRMGSEEEIARRDRGDLLLDTLNMYDYIPGVHLIKPHETSVCPTPTMPSEVIQNVWSQHGIFPREWTRYLAVDPSHTRTAVVFGVVPPPEWEGQQVGDMLIIEDELVLKKCSAATLAEHIKDIVLGRNYESFIMDQQIGRQTRVGTDRTVFEIYSEELGKHNIRSRLTSNNFIPGCNVSTTRYNAVREMMALSRYGCPRLLLIESKTWNIQREFNTYRKKQLYMGGEETILDEPANPRKHDCMAATEYLCAHVNPLFATGTAYTQPSAYGAGGSPAYQKAQKILEKRRAKEEGYVHLGPGAVATI